MIHVKTMTLFPSVIVGTCAHRAYEEAVVDRLACCSWVHDEGRVTLQDRRALPAYLKCRYSIDRVVTKGFCG